MALDCRAGRERLTPEQLVRPLSDGLDLKHLKPHRALEHRTAP